MSDLINVDISSVSEDVNLALTEQLEVVDLNISEAVSDVINLDVAETIEQIDVSVQEDIEQVNILIADPKGEKGDKGDKGDEGPPGNAAGYRREVAEGLTNGINRIFTTDYPIQPDTERVYCNGIPNRKPSNYTVTGLNEITFTTAPGQNWYITIDYEEET